MSMLHAQVYAACPSLRCMPKSTLHAHVRAARPCGMPMSVLQVHFDTISVHRISDAESAYVESANAKSANVESQQTLDQRTSKI